MRLRLQLLCVCVLGVGALIAGMPTAQAVGLIHLEDWADDLKLWDIDFTNDHTILHSEDLNLSTGVDADFITNVDSYQYLIFSRLSLTHPQALQSVMNDVRHHEDAFYHYSGPACLVGFRSASDTVELRWRLDYRNFTDDAPVLVEAPSGPLTTYRVHRGTSPGQYTFTTDLPAMTGNEGVFTDSGLAAGSPTTIWWSPWSTTRRSPSRWK